MQAIVAPVTPLSLQHVGTAAHTQVGGQFAQESVQNGSFPQALTHYF
jgi:hypothetical protein